MRARLCGSREGVEGCGVGRLWVRARLYGSGEGVEGCGVGRL